jgi:hypothetical protein
LAEKAAYEAAEDEQACHVPQNQSGKGVACRGSCAERRTPNAVIATSDEPTACSIIILVAPIRPGTIKNPPPIPKKPEAIPVKNPVGIRRTASRSEIRTPTSSASGFRRSMEMPTPNIATVKARRSF